MNPKLPVGGTYHAAKSLPEWGGTKGPGGPSVKIISPSGEAVVRGEPEMAALVGAC